MIRRIGQALDHLISGGLTLRMGVHVAEKALSKALEQYGEESEAAAIATEELMQADFALRYWRTAPSDLRRAISAAQRAGAGSEDLRVLTLNRELVIQDGTLQVRTPWVVLPLTIAMAAVAFVGFLMLCAMVATAPTPLSVKATLIAALLAIFSVLYWGWSLYTSRAMQAGRRLRAHLEHQQRPSNVVRFGRLVE